jgi:hypothetical protein
MDDRIQDKREGQSWFPFLLSAMEHLSAVGVYCSRAPIPRPVRALCRLARGVPREAIVFRNKDYVTEFFD